MRYCWIVLVLGFFAGCVNPGQRLLDARIEKDGKTVLQTQFAVPDDWNMNAAWQQIGAQTFTAVGELTPDPAAPWEVTLKGKVRVVLVHGGTPFASADVEELNLLADPTNKGRWQVSEDEVSRVEKFMK